MTDARHSPAADFLADHGADTNADFFGDTSAQVSAQIAQIAQPADLYTFEGQLVHNAELRTTTAADGLHSIPIVCLELRPLDRKDRRRCQAQIAFTDATRREAEQCAKQHKKGMVIKVAACASSMRMTLPQAQIINAYTPS